MVRRAVEDLKSVGGSQGGRGGVLGEAGGADGGGGAAAASMDVRVRQTRHLLFLMLLRYVAVGVVASPFVIWTGAYTYAYLFRVDICASREQGAHPGFLDGPGAPSSLGGFLIDHLGRRAAGARPRCMARRGRWRRSGRSWTACRIELGSLSDAMTVERRQ